MEENITKTSLEKLKKQNDLFFQIDYIKSKTFNELIYNIFNLFIPNYINSILMFELASLKWLKKFTLLLKFMRVILKSTKTI